MDALNERQQKHDEIYLNRFKNSLIVRCGCQQDTPFE